MKTIKSFTDIEQSKVLAEILPLDSADYFYKYSIGHYNMIHYNLEMYPYNRGANKNHDIPCWSLSALLDALPNENMLVKTTDGKYYCIAKDIMTMQYDNPLDACYKIILELKERNLI